MSKAKNLFAIKWAFAAIFVLWCAVANAQTVWVDVRSIEEHQADHVKGDVHIPLAEIGARIPELYPDKNTELVFYCRSGRRSGLATEQLKAAGYNNVRNAGGIEQAREERNLSK